MRNPKSQTISNDKAQMTNGVVLAFKHLDFNCHLDFGIWNLGFGGEAGAANTIFLLLMAY
jgi:hypothetical protein